jgi:hypothetical protein
MELEINLVNHRRVPPTTRQHPYLDIDISYLWAEGSTHDPTHRLPTFRHITLTRL